MPLSFDDQAIGREVDCSNYKGKGSQIACPRHLQPICGTDHKTYSNECMFFCIPSFFFFKITKSTLDIECTEYSDMCTMDYRPLCGSDGKNYSNKCSFCNAVVKSRGTIFLAKHGEC
uniref:Double-headed protease inhibitor, submandibular gland n=1 Tax=Canis lupus dingo TaxID=286419 RepID=A0A8C0LJD6_CANLU